MRILISISGNDGSGKSTLIRRIKYFLHAEGCSVTVIPIRLGFTPIVRKLKKIFRISSHSSSSTLIGKNSSTLKSKGIFKNWIWKLYEITSIIDLALTFIAVRFRRPLSQVILTDRFFQDNWIYYQDKYANPKPIANLLWKLVKKIAGKPDIHFVLLLPGEESYRRITSRWDLIEESLEQLESRAKLYAELDRSHLIILDATQPPDVVYEEAVTYLKSYMYRSKRKSVLSFRARKR